MRRAIPHVVLLAHLGTLMQTRLIMSFGPLERFSSCEALMSADAFTSESLMTMAGSGLLRAPALCSRIRAPTKSRRSRGRADMQQSRTMPL